MSDVIRSVLGRPPSDSLKDELETRKVGCGKDVTGEKRKEGG